MQQEQFEDKTLLQVLSATNIWKNYGRFSENLGALLTFWFVLCQDKMNERKNYYRFLCGVLDKLITRVFSMALNLSILIKFQPYTFQQISYVFVFGTPIFKNNSHK